MSKSLLIFATVLYDISLYYIKDDLKGLRKLLAKESLVLI